MNTDGIILKICISCGKEYEPHHGYQKKCNDCRFPISEVPEQYKVIADRNCIWCNKKFTPTHNLQLKCEECRKKRTKKKKEKKIVTSVVVRKKKKNIPVKNKRTESPDLNQFEYTFYDPKLKRTFYFRNKEKYDKFISENIDK